MSTRNINIDGRRYTYKIGPGYTEVRLANKVVLRARNEDLIGVTPYIYERGQHKGTCDGAVMPSHVVAAMRAVKCGTAHFSSNEPAWSCHLRRGHAGGCKR